MAKLKRGMLVRLSDGSTELVTGVFRFPANTKFRRKGRLMFQSKNWIYHDAEGVKILGFHKK